MKFNIKRTCTSSRNLALQKKLHNYSSVKGNSDFCISYAHVFTDKLTVPITALLKQTKNAFVIFYLEFN